MAGRDKRAARSRASITSRAGVACGTGANDVGFRKWNHKEGVTNRVKSGPETKRMIKVPTGNH